MILWSIAVFGWGSEIYLNPPPSLHQCMTKAVFLTLGRSRSSHFKKLGLLLKA